MNALAQSIELPAIAPAPGPRPQVEPATAPAPAPKPPEAAESLPATEIACRARLTVLGVRFETRPAESDPAGCMLPFPLSISALSASVRIEPDVVVNCQIAETAALFVRDHVAPAAKKAFGADLVSTRQESGYVCRPRNGTSKLSEHAFGNALDFGSFTLSDGRIISVEKTKNAKNGRFLAKIRALACGPFTTVLGPGSNADHATHFHFDLAKRRNGSAYCR